MVKYDSLKPDFSFEDRCLREGARFVAGVDEAGRGPWAGPVVAAAVILDPGNCPVGLNDSKKLTPARRDAIFSDIDARAMVGVAVVSPGDIDKMNILRASLHAMAVALDDLDKTPCVALIDGNQTPPTEIACETVVKGDARSLSIAAASIVAKVTRDRIMTDLAGLHPGYGWETNMGYGTKAHQDGLRLYGVTSHHRRSFKPIAALIDNPNAA